MSAKLDTGQTRQSNAFVFGYGSLVNADTHDYPAIHTAQLQGWRRAWRYTSSRDVAFLTMVPDERAILQGAIAPVPAQSWDALDMRERAYARHDVTHQISTSVSTVCVRAYAIAPGAHHAPSPDHPILQSYLDTVLMGFEALFGESGLTDFLHTTDGWHAPILRDRNTPSYPRSQPISEETAARYDAALLQMGVRWI
ncbi:gamma-glutamylcyclotransferase family protein [Roseobacteraceae bacterium S113]